MSAMKPTVEEYQRSTLYIVRTWAVLTLLQIILLLISMMRGKDTLVPCIAVGIYCGVWIALRWYLYPRYVRLLKGNRGLKTRIISITVLIFLVVGTAVTFAALGLTSLA